MSIPRWEKTPVEVIHFRWRWHLMLAEGEAIASSTWIVASGLTQSDEASDETVATLTLTGGTVGRDYLVTNRITTTMGNLRERSGRITVVAIL